MKRLSIITVNRNNADGLRQTIESVTCQTFGDFEFIIIDGSSDDHSIDLIKEHQQHLSYWISESDRGIYHAMNKGIAAASGEYCLFLNSGDFLLGKTILENLFSHAPETDIISCNVLKIRPNNKYRRVTPPDKISLHKLCVHSLPHQASLIRTSLFYELGPYNEGLRIASDWEFFLKAIVMNGKSYMHADIDLSFFRIGGVSSRNENIELSRRESYEILKRYFPLMADDLMDYRNFYNSNIGQLITLLKTKKKLYDFTEDLLGFLFSSKKKLIGK